MICRTPSETPVLTLQEDYEEAALTFSGKHTLTVEQIADLIFVRVLKEAPESYCQSGSAGQVGSAMPVSRFV